MMSRRGNCHDNAAAESFFATFKKRVTQRKICSNRDYARTEIFNLTRCSTIRQSNIVILEVFLQLSAKKTIFPG